jgi:hypothetical protein
MAIIVDEDKNKANIFRIFGWIGILIILGATVYYVFFSAPEIVVISPPASFQYVTPLASVTLHPLDVLNGAAYLSLKSTVPLPTPTGPVAVGRTDPFLP